MKKTIIETFIIVLFTVLPSLALRSLVFIGMCAYLYTTEGIFLAPDGLLIHERRPRIRLTSHVSHFIIAVLRGARTGRDC